MLNAIYCLGDTNTVVVILVGVTIKRLKLAAFFPSQCVTEIICWVADEFI